MSNPEAFDSSKRNWLIASGLTGGVAAAATAVPFITSMAPSERARAAGAPVEVDISDLKPGEMKVAEWRGKPVWIVRRTEEMLSTLEKVEGDLADPESKLPYSMPTPAYANNRFRSREDRKEILVTVGICPHLGCSPTEKFKTGPQPSLPDDWMGGFLCPCHGSTFDLSGRVFKNKPSPNNLDVPPFMFLSDTRILIGKDEKGEG